jgi:hypothetical protein
MSFTKVLIESLFFHPVKNPDNHYASCCILITMESLNIYRPVVTISEIHSYGAALRLKVANTNQSKRCPELETWILQYCTKSGISLGTYSNLCACLDTTIRHYLRLRLINVVVLSGKFRFLVVNYLQLKQIHAWLDCGISISEIVSQRRVILESFTLPETSEIALFEQTLIQIAVRENDLLLKHAKKHLLKYEKQVLEISNWDRKLSGLS